MRYLKAFVKAIQLTASGQQIQPPTQQYPALMQWIEQGRHLVNTAYKQAEQNDLNRPKRETIVLELDRRPISMETILGAVQHNLTLEYPMLLEARVEHNITTLYALNLNDQHRVVELANVDRLPAPVQQAVQALAHHLQNIPSSQAAE